MSEAFPEGMQIDLEGRSLHAYLMGEPTARPAVVFEAGSGGFGAQWSHIQPLVADHTLTVSYDRAGLGRSEPGPRPRSSDILVEELAQLLAGLDVAPPYVLVGHSLGGLLMRCFAGTRPGEVAGLVLLDASHEMQNVRAGLPNWLFDVTRLLYGAQAQVARWPRLGRALAARGAAVGRDSRTPQEWARYVALSARQERYATMRAETAHFDALFGEDHSVPDQFGDLPLRVITAGESLTGSRRRFNAGHQANQVDLLGMSTEASQVTVPGASHMSILVDGRYAATVAEAILSLPTGPDGVEES